ncbi:hypothetical protein OHB01_39775 [Microbispora hainanensis]|jgi:hypothetical protein|uniref:Uncharacterized protein n=1 Tax=Microbispora hainanensis TaxID=568844 RepID=A0ABZ1T092_9ACTN|nr:hypothetical protein [Microbispora hainanensis]
MGKAATVAPTRIVPGVRGAAAPSCRSTIAARILPRTSCHSSGSTHSSASAVTPSSSARRRPARSRSDCASASASSGKPSLCSVSGVPPAAR